MYRVGWQLFADDSGLYDSFQQNQAAAGVAVWNLESCCRVERMDISKHAQTERRQDRGHSL